MHITIPTHLKVVDPLCHIYQMMFLLKLSIDLLRHLVRHLLSPIRFANQCDQIRQNLAILEKIEILWLFLQGLFNIWQIFEHTLANF